MLGGRGYSVYQVLLRKGLSRRFPDLSRGELDFMVQVASRDFLNYILVKEDLLYEDEAEARALARLSDYGERSPERLVATLSDWLDVWEWKWRQRVKLVMGGGEEEDELGKAVAPTVGRLRDYGWFRRFALGSLVREGEVCFTDTLADSAVKAALYEVVRGTTPERAVEVVEKNPLVLVEGIVRRVRQFKRYRGELVVVRLSPEFFRQRSYVEWW